MDALATVQASVHVQRMQTHLVEELGHLRITRHISDPIICHIKDLVAGVCDMLRNRLNDLLEHVSVPISVHDAVSRAFDVFARIRSTYYENQVRRQDLPLVDPVKRLLGDIPHTETLDDGREVTQNVPTYAWDFPFQS